MGQYLLGGLAAKNPFTAKELSIHIYTAEELCYYIFNNMAVLADDFIQADLVDFIRVELRMTGLAERIDRYYQTSKDRDLILLMILRDTGYYNEVEIAEFQEQSSRLRHMNPMERRRDRGDLFVQKGYYQKALDIYLEIMRESGDPDQPPEFYAKTYQHIAVCYANLFQYEMAMNYMQRAYRESKSSDIQKQIYFLSRLQKQTIPRELQDVDENTFKKWEREYAETERKCQMKVNSGKIASIYMLDEEEREKELSQYLADKKRQYREMGTDTGKSS